jgi:hypothetical protein
MKRRRHFVANAFSRRPAMTLTEFLICTVAIELSRSRSVIGVLPPAVMKVGIQAIVGGDTARLMDHLDKIKSRLGVQ